jgi:CheY-like chemotaxis protein/anti-sigma regulatory factor (Ser/Thr protein kinase)
MADASQVHQVIMNLTTNAWHAIGDRPGKVTVSVTSEWIDAHNMRSDLPQGHWLRIDVSDTGSGMNPATLERIFEPFFTTKPAGRGTGLGLSVAHGIMKAHRGAITVDSTPGAGTTFHLYFPAAQPGIVREEGALRMGPTRGAGEHVLFVDDEQTLVDIAVRMLGSMGYRVTGHTSGERALAAFRSSQEVFDIVVTDHNMPGMSGIELAQEIARTAPRTPVVLVSGFLREDELQRTLELGVAEVVMKPTTFEHLAALIRAMLERGRAKRADVA